MQGSFVGQPAIQIDCMCSFKASMQEGAANKLMWHVCPCCRPIWAAAGGVGGPGAGRLSRLLVAGDGAPKQARARLPFLPAGDLQGERLCGSWYRAV